VGTKKRKNFEIGLGLALIKDLKGSMGMKIRGENKVGTADAQSKS
jgi:hypothetical protein